MWRFDAAQVTLSALSLALLFASTLSLPADTRQSESAPADNDSDVSRKVIGSSVVTSVSVIMETNNGSHKYFADAAGHPVGRPTASSQVASPISLLTPDRYEFYTFNDNGDLVKRLMTLAEIQGIIAAGGDNDDIPTIITRPEDFQMNTNTRVHDVVANVQSVLKEEMAAHENGHMEKPILDTPDITSTWSMILPSMFGQGDGALDVAIIPDLEMMDQVPLGNDVKLTSGLTNTPEITPTTKPQPTTTAEQTTQTTEVIFKNNEIPAASVTENDFVTTFSNVNPIKIEARPNSVSTINAADGAHSTTEMFTERPDQMTFTTSTSTGMVEIGSTSSQIHQQTTTEEFVPIAKEIETTTVVTDIPASDNSFETTASTDPAYTTEITTPTVTNDIPKNTPTTYFMESTPVDTSSKITPENILKPETAVKLELDSSTEYPRVTESVSFSSSKFLPTTTSTVTTTEAFSSTENIRITPKPLLSKLPTLTELLEHQHDRIDITRTSSPPLETTSAPQKLVTWIPDFSTQGTTPTKLPSYSTPTKPTTTTENYIFKSNAQDNYEPKIQNTKFVQISSSNQFQPKNSTETPDIDTTLNTKSTNSEIIEVRTPQTTIDAEEGLEEEIPILTEKPANNSSISDTDSSSSTTITTEEVTPTEDILYTTESLNDVTSQASLVESIEQIIAQVVDHGVELQTVSNTSNKDTLEHLINSTNLPITMDEFILQSATIASTFVENPVDTVEEKTLPDSEPSMHLTTDQNNEVYSTIADTMEETSTYENENESTMRVSTDFTSPTTDVETENFTTETSTSDSISDESGTITSTINTPESTTEVVLSIIKETSSVTYLMSNNATNSTVPPEITTDNLRLKVSEDLTTEKSKYEELEIEILTTEMPKIVDKEENTTGTISLNHTTETTEIAGSETETTENLSTFTTEEYMEPSTTRLNEDIKSEERPNVVIISHTPTYGEEIETSFPVKTTEMSTEQEVYSSTVPTLDNTEATERSTEQQKNDDNKISSTEIDILQSKPTNINIQTTNPPLTEEQTTGTENLNTFTTDSISSEITTPETEPPEDIYSTTLFSTSFQTTTNEVETTTFIPDVTSQHVETTTRAKPKLPAKADFASEQEMLLAEKNLLKLTTTTGKIDTKSSSAAETTTGSIQHNLSSGEKSTIRPISLSTSSSLVSNENISTYPSSTKKDTILPVISNTSKNSWKLIPTVVLHKNISEDNLHKNTAPLKSGLNKFQPPKRPQIAPVSHYPPSLPTKMHLKVAPLANLGLEASTIHLGTDINEFSKLCNELSFQIWNYVSYKGATATRSIFLSPFAVTSLLAMVFLGARGPTSGEMNDILKLDDMVTFNPHLVFRNITESIEVSKNAGVATSAIIRELYSDRSKGKLLNFYKERAQQFYDGHVEEANFKIIGDVIRRRTNLLVKRQTWGRINDFVKGNSIVLRPPLAALSANIFQTDCSLTSSEGRDGELYFIVLPTNRQRRLVPIPAVVYRAGIMAGYEPNLDATAVSIGNEKQIVSTIFVLPGQQGSAAPGDGLQRLEESLSGKHSKTDVWSKLLRTLIVRPGLEVQIPRFSHRSVINMTLPLQRMGLRELFNPSKADLRGLNGNKNDLYLSDMLQINTFTTCGESAIGNFHHTEVFPGVSTRLSKSEDDLQEDIDYFYEDGIRDSKYLEHAEEPRDYQRAFHDPVHDPSYLDLPLALRPRQARIPDVPRLRLDRPFLYFVRHNPTGLILHMGRFNPRLLP